MRWNKAYGFEVCLVTLVFFFITMVAVVSVAFAEESGNDITALKKEVELLRKQCAQYQETNARLEKRLEQLENSLGAMQEKVASVTTKEVPQAAKKIEDLNPVDLLPNYLTRGFEFTGYFRSGFGVNNRGGKMEAFQAPLALSKYRLGNEQDTYLEAAFAQKNWNPDPDGPTFKTQVRLVFQTQQNEDWESPNKIVLREMYNEMGNFVEGAPDVKVWAGKRFYRLPPLDMIDFFWANMSGYGGGFRDIKFFNLGKLDIAYLGYADEDMSLSTSRGRIAKNNLHFMLKELDVPAGKGTFWINGGYVRQGTYSGTPYPDAGGVDLGFMHQATMKDASNQLGLQYGYGACTSLSTGANLPLTGSDRESWRFRLTDMYDKKFNDRLSLQSVGVYQYTDNGSDTNYRENWMSFGLRPVYGLSKHLALEIEPGVDYIDNPANDYDSYLLKFTTALRLSPSAAYGSVPRFRLFATYAHWGENFKGHVGGAGAFDDNTDGVNVGVQCEHWW